MRRLTGILARLSPAGRGVVALAVATWLVGDRFGWSELRLLGLVCAALVLLALVLTRLPRPVRVSMALRPTRTTVGRAATVDVAVTARRLPLLHPVLSVPAGTRRVTVRLPVIGPGRTHTETVEVPTPKRGVYPVGPVVSIQSDLLGLAHREVEWHAGEELYVRPIVVQLESLAAGVVSDLEGVPSEQLSMSDLAFHALREYVPGDDLRHVHWRSSAKASTLLVRQYLETRRSHATVLLDDDPASYAGEDDFELAVSVAASVALRAALDDFEVFLRCGDAVTSSCEPDTLLDTTCRFARSGTAYLENAVRTAMTVGRGTSLVVQVTGIGRDGAEFRLAGSHFPSDAHHLLLRADPAGDSRVAEASGVRSATVARLEHLPALLVRSRP